MLALIPVIIFIALGMKILELEKELAEVKASIAKIQYALNEDEEAEQVSGEPEGERVPATALPTQTSAVEIQQTEPPQTEPPQATEPTEKKEASRKVYLTFDDGPSVYTTEILDIWMNMM